MSNNGPRAADMFHTNSNFKKFREARDILGKIWKSICFSNLFCFKRMWKPSDLTPQMLKPYNHSDAKALWESFLSGTYCQKVLDLGAWSLELGARSSELGACSWEGFLSGASCQKILGQSTKISLHFSICACHPARVPMLSTSVNCFELF